MLELVDRHGSEPCVHYERAGSSPVPGTLIYLSCESKTPSVSLEMQTIIGREVNKTKTMGVSPWEVYISRGAGIGRQATLRT